MTPFWIIIPARHDSSRLPGKPLLKLAGKPMILHVCERALEAGGQVVVATDDPRIAETVEDFGVKALMTRTDHASGTERLAEVVDRFNWPDETPIVNLQGDEPLMTPSLIRKLAETLGNHPTTEVATLATPIHDFETLTDPNAVKVVTDHRGDALYFSRAPIPFHRDHFRECPGTLPQNARFLRHIGIYAYRAGFLRQYVQWPLSPLESIESLEQLRILWHGTRLRVLTIEDAPHAGVDTPEDLIRVQTLLTP